MTIASVLRIACEANGLATSGTSTMLLKRLASAGGKKQSKQKKKPTKKPATKAANKKAITKPRVSVASKPVKGGGERLSASYYYHTICQGKISHCKPQVILQPSGQRRLKKIRIVTRGNLTYPQWVNV